MTQQIVLFDLSAFYDFVYLHFCIKFVMRNYSDYHQTCKCCNAIHDYETEISMSRHTEAQNTAEDAPDNGQKRIVLMCI
jgi:hypothetical protein